MRMVPLPLAESPENRSLDSQGAHANAFETNELISTRMFGDKRKIRSETYSDSARMLHLLPTMHEISDMKRSILSRIPTINISVLVATRQEISVRVPLHTTDTRLMPVNLRRLFLHLRTFRDPRIEVSDRSLRPSHRQHPPIPLHSRHVLRRPSRHHRFRIHVPDLDEPFRSPKRHHMRLVPARRDNRAQIPMGIFEFTQLPHIICRTHVLVIHTVTTTEVDYVAVGPVDGHGSDSGRAWGEGEIEAYLCTSEEVFG